MKEAAKPAQTATPGTGRAARYAKVDLSGISVRKAVTDEDFAVVGQLRKAGFSRVAEHDDAEWVDNFDYAPGVLSLIACNSLDEPVATMRVQDGRTSALELGRFVPLDELLGGAPLSAAQFARLSVIKAPRSTDAMFGLFKAAWRWCLHQHLQNIVIATPPWARPVYDFLMFEDLGSKGRFEHGFLGNIPHFSMQLPVEKPASIWPIVHHPLNAQYNEINHPDLEFREKIE